MIKKLIISIYVAIFFNGYYVPFVAQAAEYMLNPDTAECLLSLIDENLTHDISYYTDPRVIPERKEYDYGTTHLSVLDEDGNAASVTTTLNLL